MKKCKAVRLDSYLLVLALITMSSAQAEKMLTLGFDGLPDLALDVGSFGVEFEGAQVLACGSSLNCPEFPPYSGRNVIYDNPASLSPGTITATFIRATTGIVSTVSARVTGNTNVVMTAYDSDGNVLDTDQTNGPNYSSSGTGIPPNLLISVSSPKTHIARVSFKDSGNTFTVDDFAFSKSVATVILDAGHGQIEQKDGSFAYQRDPTSTYAVIEDVVTLELTRATQYALEENDVLVLLIRENERARFAPKGCGVPCEADTAKRRDWADKQEADLMVSIHTDGNDNPKVNGTWSWVKPAASSVEVALATAINYQLVNEGLRDRGIKKEARSNVQGAALPTSLTEVAFHSNSELDVGQGQTITDEERLYSQSFTLGVRLAEGILNFLSDREAQ